jgi:hypothetical protein
MKIPTIAENLNHSDAPRFFQCTSILLLRSGLSNRRDVNHGNAGKATPVWPTLADAALSFERGAKVLSTDPMRLRRAMVVPSF